MFIVFYRYKNLALNWINLQKYEKTELCLEKYSIGNSKHCTPHIKVNLLWDTVYFYRYVFIN